MNYIAHKTEMTIQTVKEHSENVATIARDFSILPLKEITYNIGLLHDIGKYQESFQKRINGSNIKIPHALCGAKEISNIFDDDNIILYIMRYCIAGHHSGLQNFGTRADVAEQTSLCANLVRETEDYTAYKGDLNCSPIELRKVENLLKTNCKTMQDLVEKFDFIVRYCFSCLTDADSLDTEKFHTGKDRIALRSNFHKSLEQINDILGGFKSETSLQKSRKEIQEQAYEKISDTNNFFIMNMPTGSGKTLCSLKFALSRALVKRKKRIIYVIPYNSIIDQTAEIFEKNFKNLNVLRHQSSFTYEDEENEDYKEWALKSTENWDVDFIITTAIQFFESIYKNKRGKLRKLHNMADSIIIFDEAHLMPIKFLEPCIKSILNITKFLNSDALLLTATMPNFSKLINEKFNIEHKFTDLIEDKSLFVNFKKCKYEFREFSNIKNLIVDSNAHSRLIIVNSKMLAREVYKGCYGEVYHLSTYMTGIDRVQTINVIKERIKKLEVDFEKNDDIPWNRKITVVSTSLIEAGVDLDFHEVYREITGLDSILQSGGRCNREGKRKNGKVTVFEIEENKKPSTDEQRFSKTLIEKYENIDDLECIEEYYNKLFDRRSEEISKYTVCGDGNHIHELNFKTYAENFNFIDDRLISIVIPTDEYCKNIVEEVQKKGFVDSRKIQKYVVSVTKWEFDDLLKQGVVSDYESGVYFLTNLDYYDENVGINFVGKSYYVEGGDESGIWI